ncbi:penicillin amidase [Arenicella chitinivorans]|uniref:Penicillin amidase n=1 Tax=Arenicella chitinivorans TaxID=1329800 RepID=A0A918VHH7_9GAMM|nr:penicillin acylase family protein [Arenicella chitinivorans]GGZ97132.1 penicillin amidase [Arenicella chitinivorans]
MTYLKLALLCLLLLILATAVWLYDPLPANPSAEVLRTKASEYDVEIIRDEWGVPAIFGITDADVSFGLAYAHAEDDFQTMQETIAATRGVLARYRGFDAAATDYVVSFMQIWPTIEQRYATDVPDDVKALATAYADGLNLYAAQHPDQTWRGLAPFTAQDVVAGFMFKTPFFYGLDKSLKSLFDPERSLEIALSPNSEAHSWSLTEARGVELGSNAIAVAPKRSTDGATRLLINSHQPMTGPVAWYETHLQSQAGWVMSGGVFPGTPVILHGYGPSLAWANTVNHIDLVDSYVLTRNPQDPLQYELDGNWHDFDVQSVTIDVHLWGPFRFPAQRRLLRSEHGSVIEGDHNTIAVRYAGMGEIRQLEQYYRLNRSRNLTEFMAAMALNALPSINYVYADRDGNIGFIHNAQYPERLPGWDWRKDLPGNRRDLIWQRYRDFDQVPTLINPESGLIFNANNTPFSATDGSDNLQSNDFPPSMGLAINQTNRALRLLQLNDGHTRLSRDQLLAQKFDTRYARDSDHARIIQALLQLDLSAEPTLQAAQTYLRDWDYNTDRNNLHAALAVMVMREITQSETPQDRSEGPLRQALAQAVDYLNCHYGGYRVRWGEVNRLVRGKVDVPVDGGPDVLRAIYALDFEPDQKPWASHGDTWIALVEWDASGQQTARVIHQFGSATTDQNSPHYADQAPLFAERQWRRPVLNKAALESRATRRYRPQTGR